MLVLLRVLFASFFLGFLIQMQPVQAKIASFLYARFQQAVRLLGQIESKRIEFRYFLIVLSLGDRQSILLRDNQTPNLILVVSIKVLLDYFVFDAFSLTFKVAQVRADEHILTIVPTLVRSHGVHPHQLIVIRGERHSLDGLTLPRSFVAETLLLELFGQPPFRTPLLTRHAANALATRAIHAELAHARHVVRLRLALAALLTHVHVDQLLLAGLRVEVAAA